MFETFNVNALYMCDQGVLELYSAGRMSGIVLNVGEGCTHVVPVQEGYALSHAIKRLPYSGKDISERLRKIMAEERGINLVSQCQLETVREMKEQLCYIALDYEAEKAKFA